MQRFERPIARRFPALLDRLSPLELADLPTPVQAMPGLARRIGHPELFVKRDDLSSALYGGNKVRKLEFLLGQAVGHRATTLVTMGGCGSNHLLATALHGRSLGLRTVGVIFPQPETETVRRTLAAYRGAEVELVPIGSKYMLPVQVAWTLTRLRALEGRPPELIPGGGSSPLGALGFVNAGLELAGQVREGELPEPAAVYLPYGTGGTAVGLAIGLQLAGLNTRVVAVRVIDRLLANRPRLEVFARRICHLLATEGRPIGLPDHPASNLEIRQGYIGPGYGHATPQARHALDLLAQCEDIQLELTYTGKAAACLLDDAAGDKRPLLLWNTYSSADISEWIRLAVPGR